MKVDLANMDNQQKLFVAYYRVSSKRQKEEGVSLEAQKKLIKDYVLRSGFKIVKEFEIDESASKSNRKAFQEMVSFVSNDNNVYGVICEKVDRLLRGNLKDRILVEDLINDLDKEIHFVKEGLILSKNSKSAQKLHFDIQNALARHYLNNLSDEVKKGYDILVSDGFYPHVPPIGYKTKLDDHLAVVDPERDSFIKRAFELCATGEYTERQIGAILYKEGFRSRKGNRVGKSAIGKILHDPFYYGDFMWQGELHRGNHEPLINKDLFDKAQEVLSPKGRKSQKYDHAYTGLFTCGECGMGITAEIQKGHTYYHCTKPKGAEFCSQKYVREEVIKEQLESIVKSVALSVKQIKTIKDIMRESVKEETEYLEESLDTLNARYRKLKGQSSKLLDLYLNEKIKEAIYDQKSKEIEAEMKDVNSEIAKHKGADRAYTQEIEGFLVFCNEAPRLFASSRPALQRELLRYVVTNPFLKDKKLEFSLKVPFNIVAEYAETQNWQAWRESNSRHEFWRLGSYH